MRKNKWLKAFRKHEREDKDWRESLEALNAETQKVKDTLLYVEMSLMEDIEVWNKFRDKQISAKQ